MTKATSADVDRKCRQVIGSRWTTSIRMSEAATPCSTTGNVSAGHTTWPRATAESDTSDVVDAHLAVVAQQIGTFILTGDPDGMIALNARFERY